jgi:hypothetical protein
MDNWALTDDHIPVLIQLDLAWVSRPSSRRFALQKLDITKFITTVVENPWKNAPEPLSALQQAIYSALVEHCPLTRPSPQARRNWSPLAAELLAGARRARRRYHTTLRQEDLISQKALSNRLKQELRRTSRNSWRRYIEESTTESAANPHNKGLWRLARWSKRSAEKSQADPHLPALRRQAQEPTTQDNQQKTDILAEKFFPTIGQADLSNIDLNLQPNHRLFIPHWISKESLLEVVKTLPNGKAPGPDRIPNEILKIIIPAIAEDLAQAISNCFAKGLLPNSLKESTTIPLKKEQKEDYSLPENYRPIALENTIAKLLEKILANHLA